MGAASRAPREIIDSLRRRLTMQALWRSALFFIPPLLAAWYIVFFLYRFAWLGPDAVMLAAAAFLIAASALAAARFWRRAPAEKTAALLLDRKTGGADRFVTLATIEPALWRPDLVSRLQAEAAALGGGVEFRRDFPFRVERPVLNAFIGALIAVLLFHLFFELWPLIKGAPGGELAPIAERLSHLPGREKLAARLKALAAALADPALSDDEKKSLIEQLQSEIARARARARAGAGADGQGGQSGAGGQNGEGSESSDLLGRAGKQLSDLRAGLEKGKGEGKGQAGTDKQSGQGGGAKEGAAAGKQDGAEAPAPAAGGKNQARSDAPAPGRELKAGAKPDEQKKGESGDGSGRKPEDLSRLEAQGGAGGASKGAEGAGAKSDSQTPPPFLRPGEKGAAAAKDARFVVVELPEPEAPATGAAVEGKRKSAGAGVETPGNLPLAQPRPEAGVEKQMLPLEYRGLLR